MTSPRERFVCYVLSLIGTVGLVAMSAPAPAASGDAVQQRTAPVQIRTL